MGCAAKEKSTPCSLKVGTSGSQFKPLVSINGDKPEITRIHICLRRKHVSNDEVNLPTKQRSIPLSCCTAIHIVEVDTHCISQSLREHIGLTRERNPAGDTGRIVFGCIQKIVDRLIGGIGLYRNHSIEVALNKRDHLIVVPVIVKGSHRAHW